ncbi:MAG: hypothetical protein ACE5F7_10405 [Nitrospiria bacterium]
MEDSIKKSLAGVLESMENLNHVFESKLIKLAQEGGDEGDIKGLEQGVLAMKDAGRLYLTWAEHFIERLNQAEMYDEMVD